MRSSTLSSATQWFCGYLGLYETLSQTINQLNKQGWGNSSDRKVFAMLQGTKFRFDNTKIKTSGQWLTYTIPEIKVKMGGILKLLSQIVNLKVQL